MVNRLRHIVLLSLALGSVVYAGSVRFDAITYYGHVDYDSGSIKQDAHLAGLYSYVGCGLSHLFEAELDYTEINYRNGFMLQQRDYTLCYSNFSIPYWRFRVGGHYLESEDDLTDGGWVAFAGAHYYVSGRWDAGADVYYSRYDDYDPDLKVYQVTPHFGINFWQTWQFTCRSDLKGYYINLGEDVGLGARDLYSVEERLSLYTRRWTYSVFGWVGEQSFAVRNDGFTVYNLSGEHTAGYGGEVRYVLSDRAALTLRVAKEEFEDFPGGDDTDSVTCTILLGYTF